MLWTECHRVQNRSSHLSWRILSISKERFLSPTTTFAFLERFKPSVGLILVDLLWVSVMKVNKKRHLILFCYSFNFFFFSLSLYRMVPVPDHVIKCALTFNEGKSTHWAVIWIPLWGTANLWKVTFIVMTLTLTRGCYSVRILLLMEGRNWCLIIRFGAQINIW